MTCLGRMDLSQLTLDEVAQLRTLLFRTPAPSAPASSTSVPVAPPPGAPVTNTSVQPFLPSQPPHPLDVPSQQGFTTSVSQTQVGPMAGPSLPITQPYQSMRVNSQPAPFQPFLGVQSLGLNLATGHANQARRASAAATLPRQPALTARRTQAQSNRRVRGVAVHPPALPNGISRQPSIGDCLVLGAAERTFRITAKVHFPIVSVFFSLQLLQY